MGNSYAATLSLVLLLFVYLFASRDIAKTKDFVYFDLSPKMRKLLYVRKVPMGEISFSSVAMQISALIAFIMALLSLAGVNVIAPLLALLANTGKIEFVDTDNRYIQVVFCAAVWFIVDMLILIYLFVCAIFAPKRLE
jgi:hypothetical protein